MTPAKLIVFSLWGNIPKYTVGAIRNAELVLSIYPGWTAKFYIAASTDRNIIQDLRDRKAIVVEMPDPGDHRTMLWRFRDIADPAVSHFLSRDCDSRLNLRERAAVDDWIQSGKTLHVMRDHPRHTSKIMGGMFGIRGGVFRDLQSIIDSSRHHNLYGCDQEFLNKYIYPQFAQDVCIHDEFYGGRHFPVPRTGLNCVGRAFDEHDCPIPARYDFMLRLPLFLAKGVCALKQAMVKKP